MFKLRDKVQVVNLNPKGYRFNVAREMKEEFDNDRARAYTIIDCDKTDDINRYKLNNGWWYEEHMIRPYEENENDLFRNTLLKG